MDNLDTAYHEAAHAVMAHLSKNRNLGLALYPGKHVKGISSQDFPIQKYLDQVPESVKQEIKNLPNETKFIQEQIKATIIILLSGSIVQNIYLKKPPRIIPDYIHGSDDKSFGEILDWYCKYVGFTIDSGRRQKCYSEINQGLYEEITVNKSIWMLISKLAEKLYRAKCQKLTSCQINRNIVWNQLKQAQRAEYSPKLNIDILGIIRKYCA